MVRAKTRQQRPVWLSWIQDAHGEPRCAMNERVPEVHCPLGPSIGARREAGPNRVYHCDLEIAPKPLQRRTNRHILTQLQISPGCPDDRLLESDDSDATDVIESTAACAEEPRHMPTGLHPPCLIIPRWTVHES